MLVCGRALHLAAPLNWFGTYFRMIQSSLVDMENLIDLLAVKPEVVDRPGAAPITFPGSTRALSAVGTGDALPLASKIEFENVHFAYDPSRPILKGVSFVVEAGQTVAIVGSTGGGKSTIMRLLFRFYDVDSGRILIDDRDVTKNTIKSVRKACGVVPQDTVLFNNTIKYNLLYGAIGSPDAAVEEAARSAEIHDSILTFKDKCVPPHYFVQSSSRRPN
jgi:ABC-type transport system involved in Fe-S cluster assembly fused permease/ATPase subunit